MKILFVGMPFSTHVSRWISQLRELGWQIHFFSSYPYAKPHPDLKNIIYHDYLDNINKETNKYLIYRAFQNNLILYIPSKFVKKWIGKLYRFCKLQKSHQQAFETLVQQLKPDIIHSMESQNAGYMVSEYFNKKQTNIFPKWIHTTFGIDIDYFGRFSDHRQSLQLMFSKIDVFLAEGKRDIKYAEELGFKGKSYIFAAAGGGYDINFFKKYQTIPPSKRKKIFVKGYQNSARRGLVAIRALVRCCDILDNYDVYIFSCAEEVLDYIQYVNYEGKINLQIYKESTYEDWIKSLSEACITITNNLSDGIPSTLFESMLVGAFPIQSNTSMADEWITQGVNGFLVPPEDPEEIEKVIRKVIGNHKLIEDAALTNYKLISEKLNSQDIKERVINMYYTSIK